MLCAVLPSLDALDVSGNPLGGEGVCALLLAHAAVEQPCKLRMEDVCVRPDSALPALLLRAAEGQPADPQALEAAGARQMAARVLAKAAAAKPPAKKGGGGGGAKANKPKAASAAGVAGAAAPKPGSKPGSRAGSRPASGKPGPGLPDSKPGSSAGSRGGAKKEPDGWQRDVRDAPRA